MSQIKECAAEFQHLAKTTAIPVFLIGHITKDGTLAGPKILEHIVDTVLQFEGDQHYGYRIVRCIKNRFGSTSELGIFEMNENGLREVLNPSEILVSQLTMQVETGIQDLETQGRVSLQLSQNNPNPFEGTTYANLTIAEAGDVAVEITDVTGRVVGTKNLTAQSGIHQLRITLSTAGMYFLTVRQNGHTTSIKMVNRGNGGADAIEIMESVGANDHASIQTSQPKNGPKYYTTRPFQLGDQMEYVGFATINGHEVASAHVNQAQNASETFVLAFDEAQNNTDAHPCPGTPTVTDIDGNVYNTVMIGTQCWTRENMRATRYANGDTIHFAMFYQESYLDPYYYNYSNSNIPFEKRGYLYP